MGHKPNLVNLHKCVGQHLFNPKTNQGSSMWRFNCSLTWKRVNV